MYLRLQSVYLSSRQIKKGNVGAASSQEAFHPFPIACSTYDGFESNTLVKLHPSNFVEVCAVSMRTKTFRGILLGVMF